MSFPIVKPGGKKMFANKKWASLFALVLTTAVLLAACAAPAPQVIKETVEVEVPVETTRIVEVEVPGEEVEVEVVVTAAPAPPVQSEEAKVVVKVVGGRWGEALKAAYFDGCKAETGIDIVYDMGWAAGALLKAQAEAGRIEWDVPIMGSQDCDALFEAGLLDPIDYSKIDSEILADIPEGFREPWGILHHYSDYAIAYSTDEFTEETAPKSWADFWDVENFPGPRALPDGGVYDPPQVIAWLAMGLTPDEFYPLTMEKMNDAWRKMDEIAPHIGKWWTSGGEGIDVLLRGEAVMGVVWSDRAVTAIEEGAPLAIVWDGHMLHGAGYWTLPANSPHKDKYRYAFLNYVLRPEQQAEMVNRSFYKGFSNTRVAEIVDPEDAAKLPTSPEKLALAIGLNKEAYWAETVPGTDQTWLEWEMEKWAEWIAGTLDY